MSDARWRAVPALRPPAETRPALTNLDRRCARATPCSTASARSKTKWRSISRPPKLIEELRAKRTLTPTPRTPNWPISTTAGIGARDELAALSAAAAARTIPCSRPHAQRGWRAFERMAALVEHEALADAAGRSRLPRVGRTLSQRARPHGAS